MLMGAGGSQNNRPRNVKLSIGVDNRTNTLVVSSSDQLFREIESLVHSLDDSALEAKRTVRVHTLTKGSAELVETALKPLLGKVSVSSTGRNRPRSEGPPASPSAEAPSGGGSGRSGGDDAARAFIQQRMMERMLQGGGEGRGFGFGRGGFGGNGDSRGGRRGGRGD
jgi:hypothetical protein